MYTARFGSCNVCLLDDEDDIKASTSTQYLCIYAVMKSLRWFADRKTGLQEQNRQSQTALQCEIEEAFPSVSLSLKRVMVVCDNVVGNTCGGNRAFLGCEVFCL